jgi:monoterpene epsilon-lactone hydrolase
MARSDALEHVESMYLNGFPNAATATVEELRQNYDDLLLQFPLPADATTGEGDAGGVSTLTVAAPDAAANRVLIWFHGGGYVLGTARGFQEMGYALSRASGLTVILPDYRRAPEHKFPAAVDDAVAVTRWALDRYGAENLALGGDSAGGGLTLAVLSRLRDAGSPLPAAAVLISPLTDFTATSSTIDSNAGTDVAVSRGSIGNLAAAYLQGEDPKNPLASPVFGDLHGLPPVLLMVGSTEVLLDDSRRVDEAIKASGGNSTLSVYPDMCHVWTLFSSILPEGAEAIAEAGEFLHKTLT